VACTSRCGCEAGACVDGAGTRVSVDPEPPVPELPDDDVSVQAPPPGLIGPLAESVRGLGAF